MQVKELLKHSTIYTGVEALKKVVPFLLLPVFTQLLTKNDFGVWGTYIAISTFLAPVIGLSANASLSRHFWDIKKEELSEYLGQVYLLIGFNAVLIISIFFLVGKNNIEGLLEVPFEVGFLCILTGTLQIVFTITLTLFQLEKQSLRYGISTLAQVILIYGVSLYFVHLIYQSWIGYIAGHFIGVFTSSLFLFLWSIFRWRISFRLNKNVLKSISSYGSRFMLGAMSVWIINMSDRLFINNMIGLSETGLYTIGYSFGSLMLMFNAAFSRGWLPFFFPLIKSSAKKDHIKLTKVTYLYWIVLLIGASGVTIFGPIVLSLLVTAPFQSASIFIGWVAFGYAFNGMTKSLESHLQYLKRPGLISLINGSSAVINLILNYYLIQQMGAVGAAISTLITFVVSFFATFAVVIHLQKLPWGLK